MAETSGKSAFVLYKNYYATVNEMADEQAGRLFKAVLAYANGLPLPELEASVKIAFTFIRSQMDADAVKYAKRVEANRRNGAKGGRPAKPSETEIKPDNPVGYEQKPQEAEKKPARTVKEYTPEFEELWKLYPIKDDKWSGYQKYLARRKKYTHEQLLGAVQRYLTRKRQDRDYPRYVKHLETFFSSDMADFTQYLTAPEEKQGEDNWAEYFAKGGTK